MPRGGFLGSYGPGANYWPEHEPAWAVKFYLDAHRLRALSLVERNAGDVRVFPLSIAVEDGQVQALVEIVQPGDAILEVSCGKGRMLRALQAVSPDVQCTGVDISPELLEALPAGVQGLCGSAEAVPCPSDGFDVAYSVEAIERCANLEASVAELIRVTRPGGWVVIIGKPQSRWGWIDSLAWERWPDAEYIRLLLSLGCDNVSASPVSFADQPADGRLLMWRGRKRQS